MKKYNALLRVSGILTFLVFTQICEAATLNIGSMSITGGSFELTNNDGALVINPDFSSTVTPLTFLGPDTNLISGYIGSNSGANVIASTTWFGQSVSIYTASTNLGDSNTPAGSISGGSVPSGQLDDVSGSIQMDLSAWFGNWTGFDVHQGTGKDDGITSATANGTWNPETGNFTLNWDSVVDPAACDPMGPSCVAHWTLQGSASVVPVPGALILFGSGLVGLIGISRKQKVA